MTKGKSGQVLIRDEHGEWLWVTPRHVREANAFLLWCATVIIALMVAALALLFVSCPANAEVSLTCQDARQLNGSNIWDRKRARTIAASYGVTLTEAQLVALRRCFRR